MSASEPVLPEVKAFEDACATAVASYKKFVIDGVKKYCTTARKDCQVVKQLANELRAKALEKREADKAKKE